MASLHVDVDAPWGVSQVSQNHSIFLTGYFYQFSGGDQRSKPTPSDLFRKTGNTKVFMKFLYSNATFKSNATDTVNHAITNRCVGLLCLIPAMFCNHTERPF